MRRKFMFFPIVATAFALMLFQGMDGGGRAAASEQADWHVKSHGSGDWGTGTAGSTPLDHRGPAAQSETRRTAVAGTVEGQIANTPHPRPAATKTQAYGGEKSDLSKTYGISPGTGRETELMAQYMGEGKARESNEYGRGREGMREAERGEPQGLNERQRREFNDLRPEWQREVMGFQPWQRERFFGFRPEEREAFFALNPAQRALFFDLSPAETTVFFGLPIDERVAFLGLPLEDRVAFLSLPIEERVAFLGLPPEEMAICIGLPVDERVVFLGLPLVERREFVSFGPEERREFFGLRPEERHSFMSLRPEDRHRFISMKPEERHRLLSGESGGERYRNREAEKGEPRGMMHEQNDYRQIPREREKGDLRVAPSGGTTRQLNRTNEGTTAGKPHDMGGGMPGKTTSGKSEHTGRPHE